MLDTYYNGDLIVTIIYTGIISYKIHNYHHVNYVFSKLTSALTLIPAFTLVKEWNCFAQRDLRPMTSPWQIATTVSINVHVII